MKIKIILSLFFLISLVLPLCVDPLQREGECTKCNALDVLIDGRCFVKLRGCSQHQRIKNTPDKYKCAQCQFGYGLIGDGICQKLSKIANRSVDLNPNTFDKKTILTQSQIKDKLGDLYGSYFTYAHDQFLVNYASQLGKGQIKAVNKVQSRKGVVLTIDYLSDTNIPYQAVAFVEKSGFVREWSFGMPVTGVRQPTEIYGWIVKALGDRIKGYNLYDYRFEEGAYVLEFMNSSDYVIRVSINKADIQNQIDVGQKLVVKNLSLAYLAIQNFSKSFHNYKPEDITDVRKFDDFYVVDFGPFLTVSFTFYNDKFITNMPIYRPSYQATGTQANGKQILGGFSTFTNYKDPGFLSCIQYAIKIFPELLNVSIVKVQSQSVQGTIYNISLKKQATNSDKTDYYQVQTYLSFDSSIQLNSLKKNDEILYHFQYNYNEDAYFFKAYKQLSKQKIQITNQGITSVLYKTQDNKRYYKVVYNPKQYAEMEISTITNVTKLLSVVIHGENVLETLAPFRDLARSRNPQILLKFIKDKEPSFNYSRIQQIIQNQNMYSLKITNSQGTYVAILEDKGGLLNLINVTKVSPASCFTLNSQEAQSSQKIGLIDDFLRASFPLQGYKPQFVQLNIKVASTNYRILYANSKLKQIQIHLEEVDGAAIVTKASYMNYGFEMVDPIPTNEDYQNILSVLKNSSMAGTKIPFLTQINQTYVNSYYDDGKSTTQISIERATNKSNIQVIAIRSYLLAPDGFTFANLLIPGNPSQPDATNLQRILQEVSKKYSVIMGTPTIAFAEKTNNNTYNVMFKNDLGYQKIQAKFDQKGSLTLGRLSLTGYHESDFSNCKRYGANGKCLSCNQQTQVEYQGACFTRLNGCLIQPGNICVRCNANFIKSGQKCYQQCTYFFQ